MGGGGLGDTKSVTQSRAPDILGSKITSDGLSWEKMFMAWAWDSAWWDKITFQNTIGSLIACLSNNNHICTALVHLQNIFSGMIPFDQATLITPFADEKADPSLSALPEHIPLVQDQRPESRDFWPNAFPARLLSRRPF